MQEWQQHVLVFHVEGDSRLSSNVDVELGTDVCSVLIDILNNSRSYRELGVHAEGRSEEVIHGHIPQLQDGQVVTLLYCQPKIESRCRVCLYLQQQIDPFADNIELQIGDAQKGHLQGRVHHSSVIRDCYVLGDARPERDHHDT